MVPQSKRMLKTLAQQASGSQYLVHADQKVRIEKQIL